MKRVIAPVLASMMIGLLLVGFQNCTVATEFSSKQPVVEKGGNPDDGGSGAGGNGTGYEGKTYANTNAASPCANGSKVNARIKKKADGQLYLVKANCERLNPDIQIDSRLAVFKKFFTVSPEFYLYDNRVFVEEAPGAEELDDNGGTAPAPSPGVRTPALVAYCTFRDSNSVANSEALVFDDSLSESGSGGHDYSMRVLTSYTGNVPPIDPSNNAGTCLANQSYVSPLLRPNGQVTQSYVNLYENSGSQFKIQINSAGSATGQNPIRITVQTNYLQDLMDAGGNVDSTVKCQNKYMYNSSAPQQLSGLCYVVNN